MVIKKEYIYGIIAFVISVLLLIFFNIDSSSSSEATPSPIVYEFLQNQVVCPSDTHTAITDCEECNRAAIALGDNDGLNSLCSRNNSTDFQPPGCFKIGANSGYQFNHNLTSNGRSTFGVVCKKK